MATAAKRPFSWRSVEGLVDLAHLRPVLETLPDGEIVTAAEAAGGRSRNDYPVRAMWRAPIAGVVWVGAVSSVSGLSFMVRGMLAHDGQSSVPRMARAWRPRPPMSWAWCLAAAASSGTMRRPL